MTTPDLVSVAYSVDPDEYALGLSETNQVRPDSRGVERVQTITVVRSDQPAIYKKSLGPRDQFRADEFNIPSGVPDETTGRWFLNHTVGELQDLADAMREQSPQLEEIEVTRLGDGYLKAIEMIQAHHMKPETTIFGPKGESLI